MKKRLSIFLLTGLMLTGCHQAIDTQTISIPSKVSPVKLEIEKEFEALTVKANQGDAEAQFNIGKAYYDGHSVGQDYAKAIEWFIESANQGYARSQYNLGMMYYAGHGVRTNLVIAKKHFAKACGNGYQLGCNNLGILIEKD